MAALLVAMAVMAIVLSTVMPVYQTVARRDREAELIFRGEQYARAIGLFQQKYGNALPPDVDVLIDQRFLRKKYKDPITGGDFQFLGPNSPELAEAISTTPQQAQDALRGRGAGARGGTSPFGRAQTGGPGAQGGTSPFGRAQTSGSGSQGGAQSGFTPTQRGTTFTPTSSGRAPLTAAGRAGNAQAAGGILAVASKSTQNSMRLYNGKNKYNQWIFMAVQSSLAAGAPRGSGGQTPGGTGGRAGGRGGMGPGRSGTGTGAPPPGGTRGRGGFSPRGMGR
jgi:type II secretory pathway pseudopilin PulG